MQIVRMAFCRDELTAISPAINGASAAPRHVNQAIELWLDLWRS